MDDRIRLAKAMGWQQLEHDPDRWFNDSPEHRMEECRATERLPNPSENASDLEDLIAWLMTQGWYVEVGFQSYPEPRDFVEGMGVFLHIWHVDTEQHERIDCSFDCWKRCLFDLAARVHDGHDSPNG